MKWSRVGKHCAAIGIAAWMLMLGCTASFDDVDKPRTSDGLFQDDQEWDNNSGHNDDVQGTEDNGGNGGNDNGGNGGNDNGGNGGNDNGGNDSGNNNTGTSNNASSDPFYDIKCFFTDFELEVPAATIKNLSTNLNGQQAIYIRLALDPSFVDNSYGANSIGWGNSKKGSHQFKELVGSDHAELKLFNRNSKLVLQFKMDYISEKGNSYGTNGVADKDGSMIVGNQSAIRKVRTSLSRNFQEYGYTQYTVDSPATDNKYTPNPQAPKWEYRVIYEVWVAKSAFGSVGFGDALVEYIHASPSKKDTNTLVVQWDDCPDHSWDDGDTTGDGDSTGIDGSDGSGNGGGDNGSGDGSGGGDGDTCGGDGGGDGSGGDGTCGGDGSGGDNGSGGGDSGDGGGSSGDDGSDSSGGNGGGDGDTCGGDSGSGGGDNGSGGGDNGSSGGDGSSGGGSGSGGGDGGHGIGGNGSSGGDSGGGSGGNDGSDSSGGGGSGDDGTCGGDSGGGDSGGGDSGGGGGDSGGGSGDDGNCGGDSGGGDSGGGGNDGSDSSCGDGSGGNDGSDSSGGGNNGDDGSDSSGGNGIGGDDGSDSSDGEPGPV